MLQCHGADVVILLLSSIVDCWRSCPFVQVAPWEGKIEAIRKSVEKTIKEEFGSHSAANKPRPAGSNANVLKEKSSKIADLQLRLDKMTADNESLHKQLDAAEQREVEVSATDATLVEKAKSGRSGKLGKWSKASPSLPDLRSRGNATNVQLTSVNETRI